MKSINDEQEKKTLLKNEILLRKNISQKDSKENSELYRVNSITMAQLKINLGIILSGCHDNDNVDETTEKLHPQGAAGDRMRNNGALLLACSIVGHAKSLTAVQCYIQVKHGHQRLHTQHNVYSVHYIHLQYFFIIIAIYNNEF